MNVQTQRPFLLNVQKSDRAGPLMSILRNHLKSLVFSSFSIFIYFYLL
jgi:hypothetical protein